MEKLKAKTEVVLTEYNKADSTCKATLERIFGKDKLCINITDRVKTFEDACRVLGIRYEEPLERLILGLSDDEVNYRKLKIITKALNEGWQPDYADANQKKYVPWFKVSPSGFVFYDTRCYYSLPNAGGASRLCFKSAELAKYAGEQFIEIYKGFIL